MEDMRKTNPSKLTKPHTYEVTEIEAGISGTILAYTRTSDNAE